MQELKYIIAKNIQKLRQEKGMTQLELADKLNYSDKSVSKWERGESLPDIVVLKTIADLFEVTLDYLATEEHGEKPSVKELDDNGNKRNCYIVTVTSIFMVVLIATLLYFIFSMMYPEENYPRLCFAYAVPAGLIVWLVFNSIWFNTRRNFLIVSFLVWSVLVDLYMTFGMLGLDIRPILLLGIPAQIIIWMWSRLKDKTNCDLSV